MITTTKAVKRVLLTVGVGTSLMGTGSSFSFHYSLQQPSSSLHVIVPTTTTIGTTAAHSKSMTRNEMIEDCEIAHPKNSIGIMPQRRTAALASAAAAATTTLALMLAVSVPTAHADEYGRESEAPLAFTGETVEICIKRGPLGACTKTQARTAENDNDKSDMYFRPPSDLVKRKDVEARTAEITEGNALIDRLKQQTEDNREKNELAVRQRTMVNDSSASFGPFDGQVLILNEDGKGFTLLANPQAMRLKDAGLIADKKFTRQPTPEELEKALQPGPNILDRIFGDSS